MGCKTWTKLADDVVFWLRAVSTRKLSGQRNLMAIAAPPDEAKAERRSLKRKVSLQAQQGPSVKHPKVSSGQPLTEQGDLKDKDSAQASRIFGSEAGASGADDPQGQGQRNSNSRG